MCNLHLCHYRHFVHGHTEQWQGWLEEEAIHRIGHPTFLITELFLDQNHPLASIYIGHKYLHVLCLFGEICPYTSSPNIFLTTFSVMLLPSPRSSSQTTSYYLWINWSRDHRGMLLTSLFPWLSSYLSCTVRSTFPAIMLPTVGWVLLHQLQLRKCLTDMPTGTLMKEIPQLRSYPTS